MIEFWIVIWAGAVGFLLAHFALFLDPSASSVFGVALACSAAALRGAWR